MFPEGIQKETSGMKYVHRKEPIFLYSQNLEMIKRFIRIIYWVLKGSIKRKCILIKETAN